jgi:LPS-assembly lipoprotein
MQLKLIKNPIVLALLSTLLMSCGWQLRGGGLQALDDDKKIGTLKLLSENRSSEFYQAFQKILARQHIEENSESELLLSYSSENLSRQPLAYGSTGIPIQYQLNMSIEFSVAKRNGEWLLSPRRISARRNYDFDAELIIAKDREEQALLREMREELATQLIRSIQQAL